MSIYPTLRYDDARVAIAYLTGTLGLVEQHVSTGDDGTVAHAELSFGDGVVMLGTRRASVTNAIHNLEAENLIRARRGLLTIRDRAGLEKYCGPFYGAAEARYAEIMGGTPQISAEYGM